MNYKNIYYLTENMKENEPIYCKDGNLVGHYTGYSTRPTHLHEGTIQLSPAAIFANQCSTMWVYGKAVYIPGFGFKFVDDFTAEFINF